MLLPPVSVLAANLITLGPLAVRGLAGSLRAHSHRPIHTVPCTRDPRGPLCWTSVTAVYLPQARNTFVGRGELWLGTVSHTGAQAQEGGQNNKPDIVLLCMSLCLVPTQISSNSPLSCQRPPSIDGACFSTPRSNCTTYSFSLSGLL